MSLYGPPYDQAARDYEEEPDDLDDDFDDGLDYPDEPDDGFDPDNLDGIF